MATKAPLTETEIQADPRLAAVFADIRATRGSDFVNAFWYVLAHDATLLERTWGQIKEVMVAPSPLDPLTKEMIYMAVSIANDCSYCVHSHTAAARAKGMSDEQYADFLGVVGLAHQTNGLSRALQMEADPAFRA